MERDEKKILLKAATPKEWDEWLSCVAYSMNAPYCLFCEAYDGKRGQSGDCSKCIPINQHWCDNYRCNAIQASGRNRIDAAIARLEAAGIWEGEDE